MLSKLFYILLLLLGAVLWVSNEIRYQLIFPLLQTSAPSPELFELVMHTPPKVQQTTQPTIECQTEVTEPKAEWNENLRLQDTDESLGPWEPDTEEPIEQ